MHRKCRLQRTGAGRKRVRLSILMTSLMMSAASPALAKNCNSGGLRFLGTTSDSSKTVWLSGTLAGSFRLEAAAGS